MKAWLIAMVLATGGFAAAEANEVQLPTLNSPTIGADAASRFQPHYTVSPARRYNAAAAIRQSGAATTIPLWSGNIIAGGVGYGYQQVGKDPRVTQSNPTTTILSPIIPIKITFTSFSNQTFDPNTRDTVCSPKGSATTLVAASPIYQSISGNYFSTAGGTGEYVDLFQRANYYKFTGPSGPNPNYHVTVQGQVKPELTVTMSGGDVVPANCGLIGELDYNTWDNYVQTQIMPYLATQGYGGPTTVPVFLLYNVVLTNNGCCILGYHGAFNDPSYANALHTYITVDFDSSKSFTGVSDTSAFSHEMAEWMDDPSGSNPTPSWGNIGQVSGCQANFEVGDPLSGTLFAIYMPSNGYTYHVQDLAFFSWFYTGTQWGLNNWDSFLGTFLAPHTPC